ncbi:hypothetical protein [Diaminobutyricimonas sp. LJ205]|uniref:TY-Chap2 family putative peptide chaperone n=1 Tax=Diaminobutyricimonas sp. LJ205 TaxID=2683590 RepID=UPI0012F47D98|nr:hypothetical protein [Diaminobutyricimonas sp. LJ205]
MPDDDDGLEPYYPPADRFLSAQMWWLASELARRHPHLMIGGVEVENSRLLVLHDEQDSMSIQWELDGGCKYLVDGVVQRISWIEMMAAANPHEIVERIERATGLGVPRAMPETSGRALTYQLIASALATAANDRHDWHAVPAPMRFDGEPDSPYLEAFESVDAAVSGYIDAVTSDLAAGRPVYFFQPFWVLLRDLEPVVILDTAGVAHTYFAETELLPLYESINRNVTLTTMRVVGAYYP